MSDEKRAEWAEAAQAEIDKPANAPRPIRLPPKPKTPDLLAWLAQESKALGVKPDAPKPKPVKK